MCQPVWSFIAHANNITTDVISDVHTDINDNDLPNLLSATLRMYTDFNQLGQSNWSEYTKLVLEWYKLRMHV